MAKNIPTADEYFKSLIGVLPHNIHWNMKKAMIGFAQLHVTNALEEATKEIAETCILHEDSHILAIIENAYPLTNIK